MKKYLYLFLIFCFFIACNTAYADVNYESLYYQTDTTTPKLMHNLDPYQNDDTVKYAWSPYPLFRTSSTLYWMDKVITPGYYILTPRTIKGKDYVFFKENGKVSFIIPVAKKEPVPLGYYERYVPKPKLTKWGKFKKAVGNKFFKAFKSSKKIPPPNSNIETDSQGKYFCVKLFYGDNCYLIVFKKIKY